MTGSPAGATSGRSRKMRQAAFAYLHVGILYEVAVIVIARQGLLPPERGSLLLWLFGGACIVALVFWALWFRQSVWVARLVWGAQTFRLPALVGGAFFPAPDAGVPPSFYLVALSVVLLNLWMLARAGWDL